MTGKAVNHRLWMPSAASLLSASSFSSCSAIWIIISNAGNMSVTVLLAVLLEFVWFLLLSRFDWRLRLATFCVIALAIFGLTKMVHVAGTVNGTG